MEITNFKNISLKTILADKDILQVLFNALNISWFAVDKTGKVIVWNKILKDVVKSLFPDKDLRKVYVSEIDTAAWQHLASIMKGQKTEVVEEQAPNGNWYLSVKSPIVINKKVEGVLGIAIDITKQKEAEIAKNEFLLNMQHDIRTPFSGILSMTSAIYDRETDPLKKEFLGQSLEASRNLLKLLDQILEISRLGSYGLTNSEFNILEEASSVISMMGAEAKSKGIDLTVECPSADIYLDKLRVSRILLNLVGNAIKFTEKGGVWVKIKVDSKLTLTVKDTGIGIAQSKIDYIFDKFYKVTSSYRTGQFKGAGLGLYITRQFIDELNGTITVTSTEGKGSTFTCTIPLLTKEVTA